MQRIRLSNTVFEGHNNAYLLDDGPDTVLVDTGDWTDETRHELIESLSTHGVELADIDEVFLTHWHGDHTGQAGTIQEESGATVRAHRSDAPLVAGDEESWEDMRAIQSERFDEWAIPPDKLERLKEVMIRSPVGTAPTVTPFNDGDTFLVNDIELEAVHTSGHAGGLSMFAFDRNGSSEVFTGDALLPKYTPNVGGADLRVRNALVRYVEALRRIEAADYDRAWPGHRDPIADPTARAREIIDHHEERAWRIVDALARLGPSTPWRLSMDLFGSLDGIHILHGPGEIYAHVEHLEQLGIVTRDGRAYHLAADWSGDKETTTLLDG